MAKTVHYSTVLRRQDSLIEVVPCFKEEVRGWFLIPWSTFQYSKGLQESLTMMFNKDME